MTADTHARIPKQIRSRESYERMLAAADQILSKDGVAALTLAEVSRRSGVSIGSIYCRVDSKEDLLRALHARVLDRMDLEFSAAMNRLRRKRLKLGELISSLVRELANFHRRHAPALAAFIELANTDELIEKIGKRHYAQIALDFRLLLLERKDEFVHADPERAAETSFTIIYGTLARFLGLGGARDAMGEGDWKILLEDLTLMTKAFLMTDLSRF
jgi:AcrR family transcriptional regulator